MARGCYTGFSVKGLQMIWQRLVYWAKRLPDQEAIVTPSRRLTYGELAVATEAISSHLIHRGIQRGDRVAIFLPNGGGFVSSFFAICRSGAVAVPLNVKYQSKELHSYLEHSKSRLVLTDMTRFSHVQPVLDRLEPSPQPILIEQVAPTFPTAIPPAVLVSKESSALYQYSTGSTGEPRPVARTHGQLMAEVEHFANAVKVTPHDRILTVLPLFHAHGFGNCLLAALMNGATMVVQETFYPQETLAKIQREGITIYPGVPFMFKSLIETRFKNGMDFSRLRLCFSAGAPLDPEISRNFHTQFGQYVRQLYGSTETGSVTINLDPDIEATLASVGHAMPPVEVAIFDESGTRLPLGEMGEVGIRSPAMTYGYDGLPEATAASFREGFFFPGDVGWLDEDERLYIMGRKTFFINVAGNKVDPTEVEQIIGGHPKVREVAVIGVNNPKSGQLVKAIIVPWSSCEKSEILEHCWGKMADYKIPRIIEFRAAIPKSPLGKILRERLQGE